MDESIELENGKVVPFYTLLSYSGINVEVLVKLDPDEKREFERRLYSERDVVSLRYITK